MNLEEELEVLRQNGWRWRQINDEWFEIEAPAEYAGQEISIGSLLCEAQNIHSPFFGDLPLIAQDEPNTIAGHLVDYIARHSLSAAELAEHLSCSVEALREVAYVPIPKPETIEADLEQAARETGCSAASLRRVIDEQKQKPLQWLFDNSEP